MWNKFRVALGAVGVTALAACAVPAQDYYAFPDDYRNRDYRGDPDTYHSTAVPDPYYGRRERFYNDRDGDGVLDWRDRYPDDPRRF